LTSKIHVAFIMDGNGRWAAERQYSRIKGHQKGLKALEKIIEKCPDLDVAYLTLFAFSSENWKRPALEIQALMELFEMYLSENQGRFHEENIHLRFIGRRDRIPVALKQLMEKIEQETQHYQRLHIQTAVDYGGRQEIAQAALKMMQDPGAHFEMTVDQAEDLFEKSLSTFPWPEPDFLIRTGKEKRLSNYLLWQLSYTELYFSDEYWPDFSVDHFKQALESFYQRVRRFGGVQEEIVCKGDPALQTEKNPILLRSVSDV
jgi:undecaprenyl diphosphate synthase